MLCSRSSRAAIFAFAVLVEPVGAWGEDTTALPGPAARYTEMAGGAETALAYFALPEGSVLVFSIGVPDKPAADLPLKTQADALSHLLDRFLADRSTPPASMGSNWGIVNPPLSACSTTN